ncbi:polysaccharide biosynthesis protein [Mangrovitalea sediminis]|uniref:polysaccharide biosynthesis protein n=1 Tax=Mangrovitalea sediminis TaxID=1982043 RepID=UPI000BE54513|nr:nucleoside-diphosphate sugar epimerase/dehydratase [Mangrovitalea sediminis]
MGSVFSRFLDLPRFHKRVISVFADTFLLSLALWLAFSLRLDQLYVPQGWQSYFVFGTTVAITIFAFIRLGLYRAIIRYLSNQAVMSVIAAVGFSTLSLMALGFLLHVFVPRSVPIIYFAIALIFTGGSRILVRSWVFLINQKPKGKILIYGAGETGRQLASALANGGEFQAVGFVDDDDAKHGSIINGLKVYAPSQIARLIEKKGIHRVLLALGNAPHAQRSQILHFLEPLGIAVQTVPDFAEILAGKARISEVRDLDVEDLLGRDPVVPDTDLLQSSIAGKTVMVTGAGGSIGSELCRQIVRQRPKVLVLLELSEYGLYALEREMLALLAAESLDVEIRPILGSVQKEHRLEVIMRTFKIDTVYHAAAYKHVPMVEHNVVEGVRNNVFGTWYAAEAAIRAGVKTFVLISTDKAVRPTNVMGASKRMAELVLQGLALRQDKTRFCMVRFGNVLGSSGSVVPLFREQIRQGGPVTVTHPDIYRFFMTIPEAAQLVIQASSIAKGGEVFVLDMGQHVRISELAQKMIRLMGYEVKDSEHPDGDIEIVYTGLRPGEKLYEELLIGNDPQGTEHPRIMKARERYMEWDDIAGLLKELDGACHVFDCEQVRALLLAAPTDFSPSSEMEDLVWKQTTASAGFVEGQFSETASKVTPIPGLSRHH